MSAEPRIIYEDKHILVINKPVGFSVEATHYTGPTLIDWLQKNLKNQPYYIVHRLDTPVSGLLLLAKNKTAAAQMSQIWQEKRIEKTYWAIVEQLPPRQRDSLCHHLRKNAANNRTIAFDKPLHHTRPAQLQYQLLGSSRHYHLLAVRLITGRHHQIRAQLSAIHCPIKGDIKYGAKRTNADKGICLHALRLSLPYPYLDKEQILTLEALPPVENDPLWHFFVEKYQNEPLKFMD